MKSEITQYIYGLKDPFTGLIRYIGKTNNPKSRIKTHGTGIYLKSKKNNWIKSLIKRNSYPVMEILETCNSSNVDKKEIEWIARFKDEWKLLNMTSGGTGGTTHQGKPVKIFCSNGKVYNSAKDCSADTGVHHSAIFQVLKGKARHAQGFWFSKTKESLPIFLKQRQLDPKCYDICCSNGKTYSSIGDAARQLQLEAKNISAVVLKKRKKCGDYTFWKRGEAPPKTKKQGKPLFCLTNKKFYANGREAELDTGISYKLISQQLTRKQKSVKGFSFEFVDACMIPTLVK
jgi:hypothetical protein